MKVRPVIALIVILGGVLAGGTYFYYTKNSSSAMAPESVATSTAPIAETTAEQQWAYNDYLEKKAEAIVEKEQGIPGKATVVKPTPETSKSSVSGVWVLTVPFNGLSSDLFITDDKEGTQWMDHARFDRELTEFELNEKAQFGQIKANWQAIIGDPNLASQMVVQIQNNYKPIWQSKLQQLQAIQSAAANVSIIFQSRWGVGLANVPVKYKATYQWNLDVSLIVDDLIKMVDMNLKLKDQTIANIQSKNVSATVMSANDEDRITLVGGWYEDRLGVLLQKKTEMTASLNELIKEYPRQ